MPTKRIIVGLTERQHEAETETKTVFSGVANSMPSIQRGMHVTVIGTLDQHGYSEFPTADLLSLHHELAGTNQHLNITRSRTNLSIGHDLYVMNCYFPVYYVPGEDRVRVPAEPSSFRSQENAVDWVRSQDREWLLSQQMDLSETMFVTAGEPPNRHCIGRYGPVEFYRRVYGDNGILQVIMMVMAVPIIDAIEYITDSEWFVTPEEASEFLTNYHQSTA